jgi:hypothetical protein
LFGACAPPDLPLHERSDEAIMTLDDPKFGEMSAHLRDGQFDGRMS